MYQLRLVHAMSLLLNTGDADVVGLVALPLSRMATALDALRHPDGQIALFHDSAFGVYPEPSSVLGFAAAVLGGGPSPEAPKQLPQGGYFFGRRDGDAVFCDAGPLGPDYLPGHAHGGMFSFELSLSGRRVVVDSGTYDYVPSDMRAYCRSTAAHNTVTVDGASQAEFWGAFRVGRRGRPHDVRFVANSRGFELSGWHDGFRHLPGRPVHHREFRWHDDGVLQVRDHVSAGKPVTVVSRIHLHPDCRVVDAGERFVRLSRDDAAFTVDVQEGPAPRVKQGWYCPRFGVRERNSVILFEETAAAATLSYTISGGRCVGASPLGATEPARGASHAA